MKSSRADADPGRLPPSPSVTDAVRLCAGANGSAGGRGPQSSRATLIALAGCAMTMLMTAVAAATPNDHPKAESLFEEGRLLMLAGRYELACEKFAQSQALESASGTMLNLAVCYELKGNRGMAWATYRDVIKLARQEGSSKRQDTAERRFHALDSELMQVELAVPPDARVSGLVVRLDGEPVGVRYWGATLAADPGSHEVTASAPGRTTWSVRVEGHRASDRLKVEVPLLQPGSATAASSAELPRSVASASRQQSTVTSSVPVVPLPARPIARVPQDRPAESPLVYAVGGASVVLIGMGAYWGLRAGTEWDRRQEHCRGGVCDAAAVAAGTNAQEAARMANVALGLGLVGMGLDLYWLLTRRTTSTTKIAVPALTPDRAVGFRLEGVF